MASKRPIQPLLRVLATSGARSSPLLTRSIRIPATTAPTGRLAPLPRIAFPAQHIRFSSTASDPKDYSFHDVQALTEKPAAGRILIDVREPKELEEAGRIPGAHNMPLKTRPDGLFLTPEEFKEAFGFEKPGPKDEVIFYCRSGVRSTAAAQLAVQGGYQKVGNYRGSWMDWEKNGGKAER